MSQKNRQNADPAPTAAPTESNDLAAQLSRLANGNPFELSYPPHLAVFSPAKRVTPGQWTDGTISTPKADVILPLHDARFPLDPNATVQGAYIRGARIVLLQFPKAKGGGKRLDLQMPSSGGKFHFPMIDFDGSGYQSRSQYENWRRAVAKAFITWFKENSTDQNAMIAAATQGLDLDADDIAALGIDLDAQNGQPQPTNS